MEVTRVRSGNIPSTLDLIFTRSQLEICEMVHDAGIGKSDHVVIRGKLWIEKLARNHGVPPMRNYFKANFAEIGKAFSAINWERELQNLNVDQCYHRFVVIHNDIINKFVPFKSTALVNNKPLWINKEVKCALRKKRESWMDWMKQPSTQKLDDYVTKRNKATFIKRCEK